ncbi:MAG: bifunctional 5,10-methylenetetrahydrofolate dehydrogenase/5,10-methenyltetrahydrofolate cyclohydrolase [Coriobacteriales bacterium]|nr:bifunctional 5,10-methylenetetrahydrofolate dehydrogenase/5,10-methenyltetrahydrofolate cyclohydrolase [Coriobacteriales bacterium]
MLLRGDEVSEALKKRIVAEVEGLKAAGIEPTLAIVRVGERKDDVSYERAAIKRAEDSGVAVRPIVLARDVSTEALLARIEELNADSSVHGVLMFRPLPASIDEELVRTTLSPIKDVDGITDLSLGSLFTDGSLGFAPCTAAACVEILDHFNIALEGRRALVLGRSLVVGKPLAMMLLRRNATVTIVHSRSNNLAELVREADIVIAAAGQAKLVDASYLRQGQTIIDVGINIAKDGALVGDVDFAAAWQLVEALTPVPGGVGTVTTSVLIKQVVEAAARQAAAR